MFTSLGLDINNDVGEHSNNLHNPLPLGLQMIF